MTKAEYDELVNIHTISENSILSDRKAYLFGIACLRYIWSLIRDDAKKAAEVLEDFADGKATKSDFDKASSATFRLANSLIRDSPDMFSTEAVRCAFVLPDFGKVYYTFAISNAVRWAGLRAAVPENSAEIAMEIHNWQVKTLKHMVKFNGM